MTALPARPEQEVPLRPSFAPRTGRLEFRGRVPLDEVGVPCGFELLVVGPAGALLRQVEIDAGTDVVDLPPLATGTRVTGSIDDPAPLTEFLAHDRTRPWPSGGRTGRGIIVALEEGRSELNGLPPDLVLRNTSTGFFEAPATDGAELELP